MQITTIAPRKSGEITSKTGVKKEQTSFSQAMKAAESSAKQDSVKISNRSISQKLEDLKVEFEKTDFTGMSQAQKAKILWTKYDEAFPDFDAKFYFDPENYDTIVTQYRKESDNLGIKWTDEVYNEAMGFKGMSNEEIVSEINKRYPSNDPITKTKAIHIMAASGAIDPKAGDEMKESMWRNIEKRVCQARGLKWNTMEAANSPGLKQLMHSYALNMTMTWDSIFECVSDNDKLTQEQRTDILKDMEVELKNLKTEKRG
ncbi:MAG: hypothetical protein ACRC76_01270 [Proteocatella sp.]